MPTTARVLQLALALLLAPGAATAQPTPAGDDFQVNDYTTSVQQNATIGRAADGSFVVAWEGRSSTGTDTLNNGIHARRFGSDGMALGPQFQVNTVTEYSQDEPALVVAPDGSFVVAWESYGNSGLRAQRFSSSGSLEGGEFQVSSGAPVPGYAYTPDLVLESDGDFIVAWLQLVNGSRRDIYARRYSSDGTPATAGFIVNTNTTGNKRLPAMSLAPNGDFVIVWTSPSSAGTDSDGFSVQGQRYASDGTTQGGNFQVNTYTTGSQDSSDVAVLGDGDFVVVWANGSGGTIAAQRFTSAGTPEGGEFTVQSQAATSGTPRVLADPTSDRFTVVWRSSASTGTDTDSNSIQLRSFDGDGTPVHPDFQINEYTTSSQNRPDLFVDASGDLLVVWDSSSASPGDDDSSTSVLARRFSGPLPVELLSFSVESGRPPE